MLFTNYVFLYYFLPLFLLAYYALPRGGRSWWIALASFVFYGWWRPDFLILMWTSTVLDYYCGKAIGRARTGSGSGSGGRRYVLLSCAVNLGLLAYFKYANFGVDTLNAILAEAGHKPIRLAEIILPVGISFYTFQTLSYTVDVYRRHAEPVARFGDFACYVSMFPQLVAGPIVRYASVDEQIRSRTHSFHKFSTGVLVFAAGLVKKVLLADSLAVPADAGFGAAAISTADAWLAALSYTLQIYFDFSGYSDMALGLGLMIGFHLPINFNRPYISRSITEFWRRWHISLSSFLRDYLYIPLGGNKKGPVRTYVNLSLTMLLGGLWHGAAWTFIAWGAYQGFWLVVERLAGKRSLYGAAPAAVQNLLTFIIVIVGWVLFRASSLPAAGRMLRAMAGFGSATDASYPVIAEWSRVSTAALVVGVLLIWTTRTTSEQAARPSWWWVAALAVLFPLSLLHLHGAVETPFLYFQF